MPGSDAWICPICRELNEWWRVACKNTPQHG
jgi:hypothetical protein